MWAILDGSHYQYGYFYTFTKDILTCNENWILPSFNMTEIANMVTISLSSNIYCRVFHFTLTRIWLKPEGKNLWDIKLWKNWVNGKRVFWTHVCLRDIVFENELVEIHLPRNLEFWDKIVLTLNRKTVSEEEIRRQTQCYFMNHKSSL